MDPKEAVIEELENVVAAIRRMEHGTYSYHDSQIMITIAEMIEDRIRELKNDTAPHFPHPPWDYK